MRSYFAGLLTFIVCVFLVWLINRTLIISNSNIAFFSTLLIIVMSLVLIGVVTNGRPDGILIDSRNRVSLSKFQATLWTILVIAAIVCVASHNLTLNGELLPLDFDIPTPLLAATGISATSLVAAPVCLSFKARANPTPENVAKAAADLAAVGAVPRFAGKLFGRADPASASWADMIRGEELGTETTPDLAKIQQLYFSLLLIGIYGIAVLHVLSGTAAKIPGLPELNEKLVWLMGVSHASYLAYKAAPQTANG
ncbi:MAG: hypothetical protein JOZ16_17870 [Methylobacteriaceae bacterium]|nr:hypothetical protein [Methylobacteriaceae bacterium]